jgi:HK97 family phage major capsid protein
MSMRKHITALQKKRNTLLDAMEATSDKAANDNRLFTADEQAQFDRDQTEVRDIDTQLARLEEAERQAASRARPMPQPNPGGEDDHPTPTPGAKIIPFKPFKGQGFVRWAVAIARSKGNMGQAIEIARQWKDQTPEVLAVLEMQYRTGTTPVAMLRAAVAAGTTTDPTWAGPLVYAQNLAAEFIELLRPEVLLSRMALRPVPFNVRIPRQTSTAAVGWVGQGLSKPAGAQGFDAITIPWAKMSCITVITDELARFSAPSAEMLVRDDLIESMARYADQQFTDPNVAAVANVSPGSVTNGLAAPLVVASTGNTVTQINTDATALLKALASFNIPMTRPYWLMTPAAKITLGNTRGSTVELIAWPEINDRATWFGYPILTSNSIPVGTGANAGKTSLILLDASQIFYADDGMVDIETSAEASIQMDSAPATPPTPLISLWQQNMLGIKAERYQYWTKRHTGCVGYISNFQT